MPRHAEPIRAAAAKSIDRQGAALAPARPVRCPGAAAQLAAVRRTVAGGLPLQLETAAAPLAGRRADHRGTKSSGETANRTGLPDRLKAGIEALSGVSMGDVRVHRNSGRPAQLQTLAYAQGSDIHLAPGQERHLAHEAWHVVQQKQGRVKATAQMKGAALNNEAGLEREAEFMGARAVQARPESAGAPPVQRTGHSPLFGRAKSFVLQLMSGATTEQGTEITLPAAKSLGDAAKQSAIEVSKRARKTGQDQYADRGTLGTNFTGNLYIEAPFPNGSLESWLEVTTLGGGYVKRVRVIENAQTTMDRVMHEQPGTDFQKALVTNLMGRNTPLGGGEKYASKHEANEGDKAALKISGDSSRSADNLTKIIGEGARFGWLADRLATQKIGNASTNVLKTTVSLPQTGKLAVDPTFEQLWGAWDLVFEKSYMKDLGVAKAILNKRVTDSIKYAGTTDALGDKPLGSGEKANAAITSLASKDGTRPAVVKKSNESDGMAIVTRLAMTWAPEK